MTGPAIRSWDPLVRILHWGIAALVVIDLLNDAGANPVHRWLGYAAGALVAARLLWGLVGPSEARLSSIARSASGTAHYLAFFKSKGDRHLPAGHTPPGACLALLLWSLLIVVVGSGWMTQLDAYWGDDTVQFWHVFAAYVLAGFAVIHVAGIIATSALYRANLVMGMITGRDTSRPVEDPAGEPRR
ncbi:MAG TPA: cytochrome b/b6 domain-containing protein [Burkholderiales bacterium]|nr:cytochrome b/b6 domain-containing protein [Burkholderiales bacterium]